MSFYLFILLSIVSCVGQANLGVLPTATTASTQERVTNPSPPAASLPPDTKKAPIILPTSTSSPSPIPPPVRATSTPFSLEKKCLDVEVEGNKDHFLSSGSLLYAPGNGGQALMIDDRGNPKAFKNVDDLYIDNVSPFSDVILGTANDDWRFNRSGNWVEEKFVNKNWYFRQWLSENRILFGILPDDPQQTSFPAVDRFDILSLDSGAVQPMNIKMDGFFARNYNISTPQRTDPVYDPTLRKVVYAWENRATMEQGMVLLDLKSNQKLWEQGNWGYPITYSRPDWQKDGSAFVLAAPVPGDDYPAELFVISSAGKVKQISNFQAVYINYEIFQVKWSPDGKWIAILFNEDVDKPLDSRVLYILNVQTGKVTDYCFTPVSPNEIFWSPKSDQIAFLNNGKLIVLDVVNNHAQMVANSMVLYGWVNWQMP